MPSLINALFNAQSSILTHQSGMSVISHNLSNADTEGYSRQRESQAARAGMIDGNMAYGFGVDIAQVMRQRDEFIDRNLRNETGSLSKQEWMKDNIQTLVDGIGDPAANPLLASLNRFWSSWSDLANQPDSAAVRISVREAGSAVVNDFHALSRQLDDVTTSANQTLSTGVSEVNRIANQLADLNRRISREQSLGTQPNDLLDSRDRLLDELSQWGDISVSSEVGSFRVQFGDMQLVENDRTTAIRYDSSSKSIRWDGSDRVVSLNSGKIAGAVETMDKVDAWRTKLDTYAQTIVSEVNSLHHAGKGLDGSLNNDFFASGNVTAGNIRIDPGILASASRIAASGGQGSQDGLTARALAELSNRPLIDGKTISSSITDFATEIGSMSSSVDSSFEQMQAGVQQLKSWRTAVSGVSVDEEMMNMIRHQQAYAAAGKVFSTVTGMMDQLLKL